MEYNRLTWNDISLIRDIMFKYNREIRESKNIPNDKDYCEEVLKRYNQLHKEEYITKKYGDN